MENTKIRRKITRKILLHAPIIILLCSCTSICKRKGEEKKEIMEKYVICCPPSDITITKIGNDTVSLSWKLNSPEAERVVIQASPSEDFSSEVTAIEFPANAKEATISGLSENTTYYFRVYAVGSKGPTDLSTVVSATTASLEKSTTTKKGVP